MDYLSLEGLKKSIELNEEYRDMINTIEKEVNDFIFKDDPQKISRWGHHFFCKDDGGLLIYDRNKPNEHVCEICGKSYNNELLNGVWVYMYRNEAILTAWKAALLYKLTEKEKYLHIVKNIIGFYSDNYLKFKLHNKEGQEFDSLDTMSWGCGRIMPQGLNESILTIRIINALEIVKDDFGEVFLNRIYNQYFKEVYKLLKPQVDKIHNISCWANSAIGAMGLFCNDKSMIDFAFKGEFNIRKQLNEGVTKDGFWYEGSIHYNFFTLEGITNLLLFSEIYNFDFGEEKKIVEKMFKAAFAYSFDNQQLPNPNDGWPNLNLKSYSYIYSIATKVFGINSEVGNILKNILKADYRRGEFPLSKPYYYKNKISLERLILIPELNEKDALPIERKSINFKTSYNGIIKKKNINIFYKYGHNGPSHAHPDKMNIEVIVGDYSLSRDLSNSGYGNKFCNEWHRMSASHNTVVVNGENHTSFGPGECLKFIDNLIDAKAENVYDGVSFRRKVSIIENGFNDLFEVKSIRKNNYDYFFHVEADLLSNLQTKDADLGYMKNGYQHISNVKEVICNDSTIELVWKLGKYSLKSIINLTKKTLFIGKSPDNPITNNRTTLILRSNDKDTVFNIQWLIERM